MKNTENTNLFGMDLTMVGRLTKEVRVAKQAVNFTIAVNMAGKDGKKSATTTFFDVAVYDDTLKPIAKKLIKGQLVTVSTNFLKVSENNGYVNTHTVASNVIAGTKPKIKNA